MTYEIHVEHVEEQPTAQITARVPREAIAEFLGGAYAQVMAAVQEQGIAPAGPPFARYDVGEQDFGVTAGFPVSGAVQAVGDVHAGHLPGGDVATTVHVGSYEGLPAAFHAVIEWIGDNRRAIASDPWENYLDAPEVAAPRTKVCFPLVT